MQTLSARGWRGMLLFVAGALLLAGCQTMSSGFTRSQQELLRAEGFVQTAEGWELSIADRLLFDLDSAEVKPAMQATIGRVASGLQRVGIDRARVEGHTDASGSPPIMPVCPNSARRPWLR